MKRILIYCIACILTVLPAGALATTVESPVILGGTGDDVCYDTLQLPNGNLILSMSSGGGRDGEPEYEGNVRKAWLLCLAPDGSTVWETEYGDDRSGGYTSLRFLSLNGDGTFNGTESYSISQHPQYLQEKIFSCDDGSLVLQAEKESNTLEEDSVYKQYYANNGYLLIEESLSGRTADNYRIFYMLDPEDRELWRLDADEAGIRNLEGWIAAEQGTLLYGRHRNEATGKPQPIALLADAAGQALWTYQPADIDNGVPWEGILNSKGYFILSGMMSGALQTDEYNAESRLQFIVCLDAATGEEIWRRTADLTDRDLPYRNLAEINGQYILCDSGDSYNNIVFETLDMDGNELQYWTASIPGYAHISPRFFRWNGELWTCTILDGNTMDVLLERVMVP